MVKRLVILNIRKSDGVIVDVDQRYDTRYYDNVFVLDGVLGGTAAVGGNYTWNGTQPVKGGETLLELKTRLVNELKDVVDVEGLKPILTDMIKRL